MRPSLSRLLPTIGLLLASCASTGQSFGVSLMSGAASTASGLAVTAPLDNASTVTLETGGGEITFYDPFFDLSYDVDTEYNRLEYRSWINPNARLEYFYGVSWNYYDIADAGGQSSTHALGLSVGAAYWLTKAVSFELGYMQDVVELSENGVEYDTDGLRFGLSYWF